MAGTAFGELKNMAEAVAGLTSDSSEDSDGIKFVLNRSFYFFVFLSLVLVIGLSVWLWLYPLYPDRRVFGRAFLAYIFAPICAVLAIYVLKQLLFLRGVVLEVGPQGILDRRLSRTLIPWSAITGLSTGSLQDTFLPRVVPESAWKKVAKKKWLNLHLDPVFESRWKRTPLCRFGNAISKLFGEEGYGIWVDGLKGRSFEDLKKTATQFRERAKSEELDFRPRREGHRNIKDRTRT